jgi:hypothetical protein
MHSQLIESTRNHQGPLVQTEQKISQLSPPPQPPIECATWNKRFAKVPCKEHCHAAALAN